MKLPSTPNQQRLRPYTLAGFRLIPVRSPLLGESLIYFLFLGLLRWFSSPGSLRQTYIYLAVYLQSGIAGSFQQSSHLRSRTPIPFRLAGLMVMTRALAVSLVATDETGYRHVLEMRRSIYQNPDLISIGIEQQ